MPDVCAVTANPRRQEFEASALPHLDALFNMAFKLTRNRAEAEDLVQETMVRAYRFFSRYERGTNCKAWLFKILRNGFINRYRETQRRPETIDFAALEGHGEHRLTAEREASIRSPEEVVGDLRLGEEVRRALDHLPAEFRMVVVLSFVEGYAYREIADIMSCPIGTVMSRLFRARKLLQEALEPQAREHGLDVMASRPPGCTGPRSSPAVGPAAQPVL